MVKAISNRYKFHTVALSGGCLQNRFLLEGLSKKIESDGLICLSHSQVPSNDGGISLGQAAIVAARQLKSTQ
jgi:hydrogenase maturation protein HypF